MFVIKLRPRIGQSPATLGMRIGQTGARGSQRGRRKAVHFTRATTPFVERVICSLKYALLVCRAGDNERFTALRKGSGAAERF